MCVCVWLCVFFCVRACVCAVKLRIKSFKVPELFIEIPETSTVGSLKVHHIHLSSVYFSVLSFIV